jgi:hypothetical protein
MVTMFGQDMLSDLPYIAHWSKIGKYRQQQVDQIDVIKDIAQPDFDYRIVIKVVLIKFGIYHKAKDNNDAVLIL